MQSIANGSSVKGLFKELWNSEIMRQVVPDMINFNVTASLVVIGGCAGTYEGHIVTRGNDAGIYTSFTASQRMGLLLDISGGVSASRYLSLSTDKIKYSDYLGSGKEIGGKILLGGSVSVSHTGWQPTWVTVGYSEGLSLGSYIGTSYTYPLKGQKF